MGFEKRTKATEMISAAATSGLAFAADWTDEKLAAEVRGGRTAAFGELASRHRRRIELLCRRFFADAELVRDLTQESFLKAFAGLDGYRAEMPFGGWLRTIAINACYDELRRRRRRPEELVADFSAPELAWTQLVSHASPEELSDAAEQRRESYDLAHHLLDTLRPEDRLVLTLKDSAEISVREIARTLGWSEAKVKIRAFRARQALRRQAGRLVDAGRRVLKT